jgi:hypothetical protein
MVGLGGFEPPTSRLSSARSNQLSYKPEPLHAIEIRRLRTFRNLHGLVRGRKRNEDGGCPARSA